MSPDCSPLSRRVPPRRARRRRQQGLDHMVRYSLLLTVGLVMSGPAMAATWAEATFDDLSKDFGSVPRGPTLSHPFRLVNNTKGTVAIASVRVSCGCVSASALKSTLQPGEE